MKGMPANKSFGGLHNLTITEESIKELEELLQGALKQGQTKFEFQKQTLTTRYAQYILIYYGDEGRKKRSILTR
tara:strand:- start:204 stop:425 length:222 start_codon:yes stop_codon:yes gene_type:complete